MAQTIKPIILDLWQRVNEPGVSELIDFLETSDFFTAPCSTKHHLAVRGGLAEHSLNVYRVLVQLYNRVVDFVIPERALIICGLGHDLCKVNYYLEGGEPASEAQYNYLCRLWNPQWVAFDERPIQLRNLLGSDGQFIRSVPAAYATLLIDWLKNRPREACPELPVTWAVNDQLPLGHGEKSLSILQDFIKLTDEEKLAIRWHMAAWDMSDYSGKWAYNNATKMTPLVALLAAADFEASNILEREKDL